MANQQRIALERRIKRASVHRDAMVHTREWEGEINRELAEKRESGLKEFKESIDSLAHEEWESRREYRKVLLTHQELMTDLMTAITHPFVAAEDSGKGKRGKVDDTPLDTFTGVRVYISNVTTALTALEGIPAWKTKSLIKAAVARVQEVTILSLRIPIQQAESADEQKKSSKNTLETYISQVKIAIDLALALPEMFTSHAVTADIDKAEEFLLSSYIRDLSSKLSEEDPDLESISNQKSLITSYLDKLSTAHLDASEQETLHLADQILAGYSVTVQIEEDSKKTGKGNKGSTKKPKKGTKSSKKGSKN